MRASRFRRKLRRTRRRVRRRQKASIRAASIRAAKLRRSKKKKSTRKRRGGSATRSRTVTTTPAQSYGYEHGSCPRTNAANYQTSQNEAQQSMNRTHGGAKKRRGGSASDTLDVPQFPQQGPQVGPQNANNTSVATNTSAVAGTVNATNDCYATNSCGTKGGSRRTRRAGKRGRVKWGCMSGGRRKHSGGSKRVTWGCMS